MSDVERFVRLPRCCRSLGVVVVCLCTHTTITLCFEAASVRWIYLCPVGVDVCVCFLFSPEEATTVYDVDPGLLVERIQVVGWKQCERQAFLRYICFALRTGDGDTPVELYYYDKFIPPAGTVVCP